MDRVFIRLNHAPEKTSGGFILSNEDHKPRTVGVVESIGPDVCSVKIGQKVLFHAFDELPTYDPDVVVIREESLLGVYEDE